MISEGQFERFFEALQEHFEDTKISLNSIALQLGEIAAAINAQNVQPEPEPEPEPEVTDGDQGVQS